MFGKKYNTLIQNVELENIAEDYKKAKRLGQYKISDNALYKADGSYIPFSGVKEYIQDYAEIHTVGCCGGGTLVDRIVFIAENDRIAVLFDSKKQVEIVDDLLKRHDISKR